jgi:hypothetical protein
MAASEDLLKARRESAELMGLNYDRLSPADVLRCDLISTLRLVIDDAGGTVLEGGSTDLAKLITATESLLRLLPGSKLAEPASNREDPRQIMLETYMGMRKRGEIADPMSTFEGRAAEVERLKAELAALKAGGAAPVEPGASSATNVAVGDNVVPLRTSERSEVSPSPPPAPPKPAPQPAAPTGLLVDDVDEPWRQHLNASYDPWADNRR